MIRSFARPLRFSGAALLLSFTLPAGAVPVISEFLASNRGPFIDDQGLSSDWIELHNPGPEPVDLAGWSLTDEPDLPAKWVFPAVTLAAGEFLAVRASNLDRRNPAEPLHTNFTLSAEGEFLGLYSPAGVPSTVWNPYPRQFPGISWGTVSAGAANGYFTLPTYQAENAEEALPDYVRDTHFSVDTGFFTAPFSLTIAADTPGAVIRYTTDGTVPGETTGTAYTGPVAVSTTTVFRVRAFKEGMVPSNTDTRTCIFPESWKTQPDFPAGFPETWGSAAPPLTILPAFANYGMDPAVTNSPEYGGLIIPALTQTLPVVCLTGNRDDIFSDSGLHGHLRTTDTEIGVGVEFFNPARPEERFVTRAGLNMHGGSVREHAKKAFRLDFTGETGDGELHFPLFPGSKSEVFDQLVLRGGGHDSYTAPGRGGSLDTNDLPWHATYLRDTFLRRTENAMGLLSPRGRFVHLCINGLYWGVYELHERPNAAFAATNTGSDPAAWDVLHHNVSASSTVPQIIDGSDEAWNDLLLKTATPVTTNAAYEEVAALLGPDRYIDYMLVRMWAGDHDWLGPVYSPGITGNVAEFVSKNWYAVRDTRAAGPEPWHFFAWDAEICMGSHLLPRLLDRRPDVVAPFYFLRKLDLDLTGIAQAETPAAPWAALSGHAEFRVKVADRAQRLLTGNGALSPAAAAARVAALEEELDPAIVAETARWGDAAMPNLIRRNDMQGMEWRSSPKMLRDTHWRPEVTWLREEFTAQRAGILIDQLKARNLYPSVQAPVITPAGGALEPDGKVTLTAPAGTIYYTTDGSDPRAAFTGSPASGATAYTVAFQPPAAALTVKARALDGAVWSALVETSYTGAVPPSPQSLAITEIHYHPAPPTAAETAAGFTDADDFEFLEITNVSPQPVALDSLRFVAGIEFDFSLHTAQRELAAGASMVLASNAAAFEKRYTMTAAGQFANGSRLANSGERLKLVTAAGLTIAEVTYNDRGPWPAAADGSGRSLVLLAPRSGTEEAAPDNWRASTEAGGNPGILTGISFTEWLPDVFTPEEMGDVNISGPLADPDGDSLPNIIEYLTRSHPRQPSPHPVTVEPHAGGVRFSWEQRADDESVEGALQLSPQDGVTFASAPTSRGTIRHTADCPPAAPGRRFARLHATLTGG